MRKQLIIGKPVANGLISAELPWSKSNLEKVLKTWEDNDVTDDARKMNNFDFLMILGYTLLFYFGTQKLIQKLPEIYGKASRFLTIISILPGCLELLENAAISIWLSGHIDSFTPLFISIISLLKFLMIILLLLILGGGFISIFIKHKFS